MTKTVLLCKETRAQETRVALVPTDVQQLIIDGYSVVVEHDAGTAAGFPDKDYEKAGATIREIADLSLTSFKQLFNGVDIIVRAKRPDREREQLENQAIAANTIMIGALDPLEKNSPHIEEYQKAKITTHSIDQLSLAADDPMNILSAMSKIAGRLALLDALKKCPHQASDALLIGYGTVGQSAFTTAIENQLNATVAVRKQEQATQIEQAGGKTLLLNPDQTLQQQQIALLPALKQADIVITSARRPSQQAPLLIPESSIQQMKSGAVIVDMAISEGGNVAGSEHDQTITTANGVIITNTSGYPKAMPKQASELWSRASLAFIRHKLTEH